jgi:hypothetical protein
MEYWSDGVLNLPTNGARHVPGRSNGSNQATQTTYCVLLQGSPLRPGTCRAPLTGPTLLQIGVWILLTSAATTGKKHTRCRMGTLASARGAVGTPRPTFGKTVNYPHDPAFNRL